jgi:hypothetical protein
MEEFAALGHGFEAGKLVLDVGGDIAKLVAGEIHQLA